MGGIARGWPAAKPSPRRRASPRKQGALQASGWSLPAFLVLVVFVAAFVLDTRALISLFWDSLTGLFGATARVASLGIVLGCVSPVFLKLHRSLAAPAPSPARRKRQAGDTARPGSGKSGNVVRSGKPRRPAEASGKGRANITPAELVRTPRDPPGLPQPTAKPSEPGTRRNANRVGATEDGQPRNEQEPTPARTRRQRSDATRPPRQGDEISLAPPSAAETSQREPKQRRRRTPQAAPRRGSRAGAEIGAPAGGAPSVWS
jgi:hypothetical protein